MRASSWEKRRSTRTNWAASRATTAARWRRLHLDYVQRLGVRGRTPDGFNARNQAHGAPGNLLDLYAAADIPETESFGMTPLPIVRDCAPRPIDVNPRPGSAVENLIGRFASSAAHVSGRPLASSETLTWLRENFRESPAAAKPQIDRLFAAGINHIFYHGASYSPADAAWPGWFFYASTQLNPNNPLWRDFGAMNAYVARVQSVLQAGRPDNDVLIYWPFDDLVDDPRGLMRQLRRAREQMAHRIVGRRAWPSKLLHAGYGFDFISDAQIAQLRVEGGALVAPGGRYRALRDSAPRVACRSRHWRELSALAGRRSSSFEAAAARMFRASGSSKHAARAIRESCWRTCIGPIAVVRPNVSAALRELGILREPASRVPGCAHLRRARDDGHDYFFVNLGASAFDGWLQLGTPAAAALIMDPLTGRTGTRRATRRGAGQAARLSAAAPAASPRILRTYRTKPQQRGLPAWHYTARARRGTWRWRASGRWNSCKGGPMLPAPARAWQLGPAQLDRAGRSGARERSRARRVIASSSMRRRNAPMPGCSTWATCARPRA